MGRREGRKEGGKERGEKGGWEREREKRAIDLASMQSRERKREMGDGGERVNGKKRVRWGEVEWRN